MQDRERLGVPRSAARAITVDHVPLLLPLREALTKPATTAIIIPIASIDAKSRSCNVPTATAARFAATTLSEIPELDLVDLNHANSVLAFEALCGRRLVCRNAEAVAAFASETARQYEDDMLHAAARSAA